MKSMKNIASKTLITALSLVFLTTGLAFAGNDSSIKGELRKNITRSMETFIGDKTIGDTFYIYDTVKGELLNLKFKKLHKGIVKKGDFYVSCADFVDGEGTKFDLDFLVMPKDQSLTTIQAVVHSVDGKKRKYHLEQ